MIYDGIFFVNTSQKKAYLQRRCAFFQRNSPSASEDFAKGEIRLRQVK